MRELNRGGQIYFVHNRIHDIKNVAHKLSGIVPEARIDIGFMEYARVGVPLALATLLLGWALLR